ncbi:MAG: nucleoside hydrolase [Faecalicoccus sp.]|nr:nucleoside hydrolase [Faecalicoccus sp.]
MKKLAYIVTALAAMSLVACAPTAKPEEPVEEEPQETRRVIIDTDTGADDASALILAAKNPNIEIMGVTVLLGNVDLEQGTRNALMALEMAGCDAPVYKGSADTLDGTQKMPFSVFGDDGMGDQDLIHPEGKAQDQDAIDFIIETVQNNPGEIEIIALGPATNIAKAIQKAPDVMKDVKMIWSMGSAGLGPGNASLVAEFNVYADAPAYKVMLDSGLPITVIGLDMCGGDSLWTDANFEKLESTNEIGKFVTKSFKKIRDFYNENGSDGSVMNCDALAMMCALNPDFVKNTINAYGSCISDTGETYAQIIYYQKGFTYDVASNSEFNYNVNLVTSVDGSTYFDRYLKAIQ